MGLSVYGGRFIVPELEQFSWGSMCWLSSTSITGAKGTSVARLVIDPEMKTESHFHPNCEEVLLLVSGQVEHEIGGSRISHDVGECVLIPAGVAHHSTNLGSGSAELIVVYSSGSREFVPCASQQEF
jgi:mannose-6-phosphate isomerase-like protein (cupin superfamily)